MAKWRRILLKIGQVAAWQGVQLGSFGKSQFGECGRRRLGGVGVVERQVSGNGTRFVWYALGAPGIAWAGVPGGEWVSVDGRWCCHTLLITYGI